VAGTLSVISSCAREKRAIEVVYLMPSVEVGETAQQIYEVRLPPDHLGRGSNPSVLNTPPGSDFIPVWAVYPEMQGMSPQTSRALLNETVPNAAVHIFLAVALSASADWATQKRDSLLRQPGSSKDAVVPYGDGKESGITEYRFVNRPGDKRAVFVETEAGPVLVDCSFGRICKAVRSWRNTFTVRYHFDATQIPDFRDLDRSVLRLLSSFEIKPASTE
jgi:hypothetical protein